MQEKNTRTDTPKSILMIKILNLNSAKGKEPFYEKFGFKIRPNEEAGMDQWLSLGE